MVWQFHTKTLSEALKCLTIGVATILNINHISYDTTANSIKGFFVVSSSSVWGREATLRHLLYIKGRVEFIEHLWFVTDKGLLQLEALKLTAPINNACPRYLSLWYMQQKWYIEEELITYTFFCFRILFIFAVRQRILCEYVRLM